MVYIFALNCMSISFECHTAFSACFGDLPTLNLIRSSLSKQKLCSLMVVFESFPQSLYHPVSYTTVRQGKQSNKTETESLWEERRIKNPFRCRYVQMQENHISHRCLFHSLRAVMQCGLVENVAQKLVWLFCVSGFGLISLLFECVEFQFWMCSTLWTLLDSIPRCYWYTQKGISPCTVADRWTCGDFIWSRIDWRSDDLYPGGVQL